MQDSLALIDLYANTRGELWLNHANWLTNNPLSTWFGISVSGNRVTQINLTRNGLKGKIPSSLGNLTGLIVLIISGNDLIDSIPSSLGNLTNLTNLDLSYSPGLAGSIPSSLGNLTNLTVLNLSHDFGLAGNIPSFLGNLTNLSV